MAKRDEDLQRLHDGALPLAEAEALRGQLTDEDRQKLAALEELDGLLTDTLAAESEGVDLWAGIEARLPAAPVTTVTAPAPVKAPEGKVLPLRRRWAVPTTAAMGVLAMAAMFLFFLWPQTRTSNHCEVESLEVAGGSAVVMQLPGEHGDDTTVIWMDHQENDEWESL